MTAQTISADLTSAAYTLLTTGQGSVRVHNYSQYPARIAIGTSLPAAGTDNWVPLFPGKFIDLGGLYGLTSADNVYARADDHAVTVKAVSWAASTPATGTHRWCDVAATAALLDSAGTVPLFTPAAADQYKVRNIILVGGGTNFAAGGNRLIDLTDGTTVWTTIANADIESAPSASLMWGNAKVPFLTSKSNVASVAGQPIRFVYSGGTTDHSATGSISFSVLVEKVA